MTDTGAAASQQECPICFDAFAGSARLMGACNPCGHVFHMDCYNAWVASRSVTARVSCPLCQRRIREFNRLFLTMPTAAVAAPPPAVAAAPHANRNRDELNALRAKMMAERKVKEALEGQVNQLQSDLTQKNATLQMHFGQLSSKSQQVNQLQNELTQSRNHCNMLQQKEHLTVQQAQFYADRLEGGYQSHVQRLTTRLSAAEKELQGLDIVHEAVQILTESQVKIQKFQSTDADLHVNKVQERWEGLRMELQFLASQLETVDWTTTPKSSMVTQMAQNVITTAQALVSQCDRQVQAAQARRKNEIETMKGKFLQHYMHPTVDNPNEPLSRDGGASSGDSTDSHTVNVDSSSVMLGKKVVGPIFASKTLKAPPVTTAKN